MWPDEAARRALTNAVTPHIAPLAGRREPELNYHVTLAFLGQVRADHHSVLVHTAEHFAQLWSARRSGPVGIDLDWIAHWRKAALLCATSRARAPDLQMLAETLQRTLHDAGFMPELRPFRAHVTLARKVVSASAGLEMTPVPWRFQRFALIDSRRSPAGSSYSVLSSWTLYDERAQKA